MKKIALTIAIVLTMGLGAYAQYDEDKFHRPALWWFGSDGVSENEGR